MDRGAHGVAAVSGRYITDDEGQPVPCPDLMRWARWFERPGNKIVIRSYAPDVMVSTVFLALDHGFGDGPPVLWETMVFCDGTCRDRDSARYTSRYSALRGHVRMCKSWGVPVRSGSGMSSSSS